MSRTTRIFITVSIVIFVTRPTFADWKDNAQAIDISGGEDHTLILTANKQPWACGPDSGPGPYFGVLGTGSTYAGLIQKTLVRVHGPYDVNCLDGINDLDPGWMHSLALDVKNLI